jgi:hypothetical protein
MTSSMTATIRKMPVAEVIAAQDGDETAAQLAKRLRVKVAFVRNTLAAQNWRYGLLGAALWAQPLRALRAVVDAPLVPVPRPRVPRRKPGRSWYDSKVPLDTPCLDTSFYDHEMDV